MRCANANNLTLPQKIYLARVSLLIVSVGGWEGVWEGVGEVGVASGPIFQGNMDIQILNYNNSITSEEPCTCSPAVKY